MRVCTILLIITFVITLVVKDATPREKHKTVYPYNMETAFNRKFFNMSIDLSNWRNRSRKNPPIFSPEISAWLLTDLTNAMLTVKVKHVQSGNYLLDQTVNICHFSKWRNNMLSKNLFGEIVKNVDFKLQCPFKKGKYGVRAGRFNEAFFPSFIKPKDPFETTIELKSKINGRLEKIAALSHKWEVIEVFTEN